MLKQYAIVNIDLLSIDRYRDYDDTNLPPSKIGSDGFPLLRVVVWDADPVFDPATEYLTEDTFIIETTQVRRRNKVEALLQEDIDRIADDTAENVLFDTMKTYYSVLNAGNATSAQAQKAIAWLIKNEAKKRGAIVS